MENLFSYILQAAVTDEIIFQIAFKLTSTP